MKTLAIALLGLLLLTPPAWGDAPQTISVGGLVVTVPSDWVQKRNENGLVLKPEGIVLWDQCTFTLLGGEAFSGSLKDRLTEEWNGFEKLGQIPDDDKGKIDGEGNAVELASRSGTLQLQNGRTLCVWLLIAKANDRIERMVFVATRAEEFTKYGKDVVGMINGLKYVPPKPAEALTGVCFGIVYIHGNVRAEPWIFLPGGEAYHGFPYGGPAHMDVEALRKTNKKNFGQYRTDGKEVVVTMPGEEPPTRFVESDGVWAATVTRPFEDRRQTSRFHWEYWTDQVETQLRIAKLPGCDGMKFAGTYKMVENGRRHALRTAKPTSTITFTADGEFVEDGVVCEMDPGEPQVGTNKRKPSLAPPAGGRGKYSIAKNTLDFVYDGGEKVSLTFLAGKWDLEKGVPDGFYLDELPLVKK
ncbi:MAG: hypothetical protein JWN51_3479 [Phycisphaerales bacterium]|nr:hypothetical protein [Phycisphaerales bacterium]